MLEASGFDFRNRHPQEFLIKLAKFYNYEKTSRVVKTAYVMSLDLYRTFAPLKQQTATMAFACLELAGRLLGEENKDLWQGKDYAAWRIDRGMVMGTCNLMFLFVAAAPDFRSTSFPLCWGTPLGNEDVIRGYLQMRTHLQRQTNSICVR